MEKLEQNAIIASLVSELRENGSWCGETHVQKAVYFLQEMTRVPTDFSFVLYKHGPFSFPLRDEITSMRADRLLEFEILKPDYGPSLKPTESGKTHLQYFGITAKRGIEFVAQHFGDRNVAELERLGTALYILLKQEPGDVEALAQRIVELKPHVSIAEAREALETVEQWQEEALRLGLVDPVGNS